MRKLHFKVVAAALAFALPVAMTSIATAAPLAAPVKRQVVPAAPAAAGPAGVLSPAAIAGASALPVSPFADSMTASDFNTGEIENEVYSVNLTDGQVLHASIQTTTDDDFLYAWGFTSDATDVFGDFPSAYSAGGSGGHFDIYIPAEYGADTYYLALLNLAETSVNYTVTWEILSGETAGTAERVPGADRYAVAENVALKAFPGWAGVTDVIVASGDDRAMADPLAAAGLAGAYRAPILLVKPILINGKLPTATERALTNIRTANGGAVNVHVIGGTVTVPSAVYNRLSTFKGTGTIERITGADRYALSAAMAKRTTEVIEGDGGTVTDVLIANGENAAVFYDALAASTISYYNGMPMMLTRGKSVPSSVMTQLNTTLAGTNRYLVSSDTHLNSTVRTATGAAYNVAFSDDRYAAALEIADWAFMNQLLERDTVAVANKLPDALTGGVAMGEIGAPITYTGTGAGGLDESTWTFLYWNKGSLKKAYVLGGTASIDNNVFEEIDFALEWPIVF